MEVLEFLFNRKEWEENQYIYFILDEHVLPFELALKPVVVEMWNRVHELEMRGFQFDPPDEASWEQYEAAYFDWSHDECLDCFAE